MSTSPAPDFAAITGRQQATWALGDFNILAQQIMPVSEALIQAVDPRPGERVLDIACGSGNAALIAARRYCDVTGIDYVPALIDRAKQRAAADGVSVDFRVADAQALPFPDASFDVVVSCFGIMFAPDQGKAAAELLRVCKPGGRIALANWKPEGFGGEIFRETARFVPPPPGLQPPVRWGTEAALRELVGSGLKQLKVEHRSFIQYFRSIEHVIEVMRTYFGPVQRAFQMNQGDKERELKEALTSVFSRWNRASDGTAVILCEYAQVTGTRG